ncbi:hypothetical protein MLD52_09145 [Puniceicoccaceae bacterium K14]|nr:hypothetical protein [Puniceicoccaceae bacterium K14]
MKLYVDALNGDDAADGRSEATAWQSLAKLNSTELRGGEQINLARDSVWTEQLKPLAARTRSSRIEILPYGSGNKPIIDGVGSDAAILLHNIDRITVRGLGVRNIGPSGNSPRSGILLTLSDFGTARDIEIIDNEIEQVNGSLQRFNGLNAGIAYYNKSGTSRVSAFAGLKIRKNKIIGTDRDGIKGRSDYWQRNNWYPNTGVEISDNYLEDIAGDGIVTYGCIGAVIERNRINGARTRVVDETAVGIWPWSCDDTIVRFNEVSGVTGQLDGQPIDADYNCINTIFEDNYTHDNDGGFILITNAYLPNDENVGNQSAIFRRNISVNDGIPNNVDGKGSSIILSGQIDGASIIDNIIYRDTNEAIHIVFVWGTEEIGRATNVRVSDNTIIFNDANIGQYDTARANSVVIEDNNYVYASDPNRATALQLMNTQIELIQALVASN